MPYLCFLICFFLTIIIPITAANETNAITIVEAPGIEIPSDVPEPANTVNVGSFTIDSPFHSGKHVK